MLGLKPYWLGKKIPDSTNYDDNCLCVIFSTTFEIVGRGEIDFFFTIAHCYVLSSTDIVYSFLT